VRMEIGIKDYVITGENAEKFKDKLWEYVTERKFPEDIVLLDMYGPLTSTNYCLHIAGTSVSLKPKDKGILQIKFIGETKVRKTAKQKLEEVIGIKF